ncbi:UNVERIFIED_ORG: polar amino acid transport system substrate-binding protein [Arthrobacter sp. UYCu721]
MSKATSRMLIVTAAAAALVLSGCTSNGSAGNTESQVSQSHLKQILDKKTIRIAVSPDTPGFGVMDSAGKYQGFDIDIANALGESLGVNVEYVSTTNESRIPLLMTDKADVVIATFTATNERARQVEMTLPYAASAQVFMVPADSPANGYDDLAGKTVASSRGSTGEQIIQKDFPNTKIADFSTVADSIQALKSKKADALIEETAIVAALVKAEPGAFKVLKGAELRPVLFSMGVKPGDQAWTNYLNTFIRNYNVSGANQTSLQKWFGLDMPAFLK